MLRCGSVKRNVERFVILISALWCSFSFGLDGEMAPIVASHTVAPQVFDNQPGVPSCDSLERGEERRSCLTEGDDAFLHIWGVDGSDELNSTFCVHDGAVAAAAAAKGKGVRVAINLDTSVLLFPQCPKVTVAPMDVSPEITASDVVTNILSSLDDAKKAQLDVVATKNAYTTMVQEAQVLQYKLALQELTYHLKRSGINTVAIEGSTSAFLEKVRLMQSIAHRTWATKHSSQRSSSSRKTVCEVGFNAGHSALLWLLGGADRVISFELGQYNYSHVAAEWLLARFPGKLHLVMGDSVHSVPTFHAMFPNEKCDIVLVDGGHYFEPAWKDLLHFKDLVDIGPGGAIDNSGHVLLVDDTEMSEVGAAWAQAQAQGLAVQDGTVASDFAEENDSPFTPSLSWDGNLFRESTDSIIKSWASTMSYGRYLP